jgi:hypothetical protein
MERGFGSDSKREMYIDAGLRISDERLYRVKFAVSRTLMEPRNFLTVRNSVLNFRHECHEASRPDKGQEFTSKLRPTEASV